MFRAFAKVPDIGAQKLFLFHPADLVALMELSWDRRAENHSLPLGHPLHRSDLNRFEDTWFGRNVLDLLKVPDPPRSRPSQPPVRLLVNSILQGSEREENHVLWD